MSDWFQNCDSEGAVKSIYRKLAKENHPDKHGPTFIPIMQAINAAYHAKLESLNGQTRIGSDGKEHTYRYTYAREQEVVDQLSRLDACPDLADLEIEIIGCWIWVRGDTKPRKETLKQVGCIFHSKRECWYWRPKGSFSRKYTGLSFETLRAAYGSEYHTRPDEDRKPTSHQPALIGA